MPQKCLLSGIGVETILYVAFELHTIKLFLRLLWYEKLQITWHQDWNMNK